MPRVKLYPGSVRSLPGVSGQWTEYYDTVQPGLELRISPTGHRSWSVRPRLNGRMIRVTLGTIDKLGLADARDAAREAQRTAARGVDPRRHGRDRLTVEQLGRAALARLDLRPRTAGEWERLLTKEIAPKIGTIPADQLDRATIRSWGDAIAEKRKTTARHAFEALRRFYSWGVSRDLLHGTPFAELEPPAKRGVSKRVLSTDELRAVWRALGAFDLLGVHVPDRGREKYVDATRLLVYTLAREDMVVGMRDTEIEAIDDPAVRWIIPDHRMKGGVDHVVPLASQAVEIVRRRLRQARAGFLFAADDPRGGDPRRTQRAMYWSSGWVSDLRDVAQRIHGKPIPRWTIHNLRHTAATHMTEDLGIDPMVVSLLLAHKPPGLPDVTLIYLRAYRLAERRDALRRWADWVDGLR